MAVERLTNYATLVEIALGAAAESRGVFIGDLRSPYMKFWWQWHEHRDDPHYRGKKVILIAGHAAQVYPESKLGWLLISELLVWLGKGAPDRSSDLKKLFWRHSLTRRNKQVPDGGNWPWLIPEVNSSTRTAW